jgi:hypothetical protein
MTMHKFLVGLFLALLAGVAWAFPVDLEVDAEGLNIGTVVHSDDKLAIVSVTNQEEFPLRCEAEFHSGPEHGRTRFAIIEPGRVASMSWAPRREVVRLRIALSCQPHENGNAR